MDNKIKLLFISAMFLALAGVVANSIGSGDFLVPIVVCLLTLTLGAVLFVAKDAPFDAAIIALAVGAIWFTGKGIVYINIGNLIYFSEAVLGVLLIGYILRVAMKSWPVVPMSLFTLPIVLLLLYGMIHVYLDIGTYGIMTLRDACIIYYSGFFLATYQMAHTSPAFTKLCEKILIIFACAAGAVHAVNALGGSGLIWSVRSALNFRGRSLFAPHADSSDAVLCALTVWLALKSRSDTKYAWVYRLMAMVPVFLIFWNIKGALLVSFFFMSGYLIVARQWWLFRRLVFVGMLGAVFVVAIAYYYPEHTPDKIKKLIEEVSSVFTPFREISPAEETTDEHTAAWRLGWWKWIINAVYNENPLYGLGLGADLVIEFQEDFYGRQYMADQSAVRGAHSSMFTILGRTGLIGLALFLWITALQFWYLWSAALVTRKLQGNTPFELTLCAGFLCGMIGSTFFQYGWDAPYSAVPFWVCLALLVSRIDSIKNSFNSTEEVKVVGQGPSFLSKKASVDFA